MFACGTSTTLGLDSTHGTAARSHPFGEMPLHAMIKAAVFWALQIFEKGLETPLCTSVWRLLVYGDFSLGFCSHNGAQKASSACLKTRHHWGEGSTPPHLAGALPSLPPPDPPTDANPDQQSHHGGTHTRHATASAVVAKARGEKGLEVHPRPDQFSSAPIELMKVGRMCISEWDFTPRFV